ncbi:MAG: hypothetical protein KGS60_14435 [Verrucomicrobia bacterium]|nr:hypothetical protein [Verrucomicrobiota bacterium]
MDPVSQFLNYVGQLTENLPGARAAMILLGGIVGAMLIKFLVRALLHRTGLDEWMARRLGLDDANTEQAISQFIFLILLLVVAISALNAAGLGEVTLRLQTLTEPVVQTVPRLVLAGAWCFLTWVLATLAKKIVQGVLTASRLDERLGLDGTQPLSRAILTVLVSLIWLILLPIIVNSLEIPEVSSVLNRFITQIWASLPGLVFGTLIIAFGVFVANIVRKMVTAVLEGIRIDHLSQTLGYEGKVPVLGLSLSSALGWVAMISIIVTMTAQGLQVMNLEFVSGLAVLISNFWAATLIFLVGLVLADLARRAIGSRNSLFGNIARYVVVFLFGGMALQRAEITALSSNVVEYLITGAIVAAVIAFGIGGAIAIGLGGRDRVKRYLDSK